MVTAVRRWLSGVLARVAFKVNPDPPLTFTTVRRIDNADFFKDLADVLDGQIATSREISAQITGDKEAFRRAFESHSG